MGKIVDLKRLPCDENLCLFLSRLENLCIEEVCLTDEVCDKTGIGMIVDLSRCSDLLDFSLAHDDDLIGNTHRLRLVMGNIDCGDSDLLLNLPDLGTHRHTKFCIKV